jgi:hypothetical protein
MHPELIPLVLASLDPFYLSLDTFKTINRNSTLFLLIYTRKITTTTCLWCSIFIAFTWCGIFIPFLWSLECSFSSFRHGAFYSWRSFKSYPCVGSIFSQFKTTFRVLIFFQA